MEKASADWLQIRADGAFRNRSVWISDKSLRSQKQGVRGSKNYKIEKRAHAVSAQLNQYPHEN
jgi:hypothetical protein